MKYWNRNRRTVEKNWTMVTCPQRFMAAKVQLQQLDSSGRFFGRNEMGPGRDWCKYWYFENPADATFALLLWNDK